MYSAEATGHSDDELAQKTLAIIALLETDPEAAVSQADHALRDPDSGLSRPLQDDLINLIKHGAEQGIFGAVMHAGCLLWAAPHLADDQRTVLIDALGVGLQKLEDRKMVLDCIGSALWRGTSTSHPTVNNLITVLGQGVPYHPRTALVQIAEAFVMRNEKFDQQDVRDLMHLLRVGFNAAAKRGRAEDAPLLRNVLVQQFMATDPQSFMDSRDAARGACKAILTQPGVGMPSAVRKRLAETGANDLGGFAAMPVPA